MSDTESESPETAPEEEHSAPDTPEESSGDAHLDKILEEGVLKGQARPELAQLLMAAFMVFALGWLAYTATLRADFFIEDQQTIVANENLHRIPTISQAWGEGISPIAALTFAMDWTLGGGSPVPFRTTQLLLHLAISVLIFLYLRKAFARHHSEAAAMAGGLWFALSPTATQTITALAGRDALVGVFFVALGSYLMLSASRSEQFGYTRFVCAIFSAWASTSCGIGPVMAGFFVGVPYDRNSIPTRFAVIIGIATVPYLAGVPWTESLLGAKEAWIDYYGYGVIGAFAVAAALTVIPGVKLRTGIGTAVAAVLFAFAFMTNLRAAERQDELFYWTRQSDAAPDAFEPKLRLAMLHEREATLVVEEGSESTDRRNDEHLYRLAAGHYRDAMQIRSDLDGHLADFARVLHASDETIEAIGIMREAVALEPREPELIRDLARWHAELVTDPLGPDHLRSALDYYDALESLEALTDRDRFNRADSFMKLGLAREAADQLRPIKDQDVLREAQPLIKQIQPRMSRMTRYQNDINKAAEEKRPMAELLRPRLAQLLAEGYIPRARYIAEELVRSTGNTNPDDWVQLAALYLGTGGMNSLRQHWPPPAGMENPWEAVAKELVAQKNYNAAFAALESAGDRAVALETLGAMARENGDLREAIGAYQRAANDFPTRKTAWLALAEIAIEQGQTAGLTATLDRAAQAGATPEEIEALKAKAGLDNSVREQLTPTIIR